ncbi:MAG: four helix bundle protein [Acidobacteria bacterium]|nr:four helix bundle protein [Acidobacteriota bacterium]
MGKAFRDLLVWRKSMDLAAAVYRMTETFPKSELYGLTSQMRRASISIPSNIAEGCARSSRRDFRQFVLIAKGSNFELQTQILLAIKLGFANNDSARKVERGAHEIAKMLNGLADFLATPPKSSNGRELRTNN